MNTLVSSHKLQLANQSPWRPVGIPITLPRINNVQNQNNPPKTRSLRANAKGFTGVPRAPTLEEEDANLGMKQGEQGNGQEEDIPQEVFERMMWRIVVSVGAPLGMGLGIGHLFGVAKEQNLVDIPNWIPFLVVFLFLATSCLGIAYGALSTSWDVNQKGSLIGFEQAQKNWAEMWAEEDKAQNSR